MSCFSTGSAAPTTASPPPLDWNRLVCIVPSLAHLEWETRNAHVNELVGKYAFWSLYVKARLDSLVGHHAVGRPAVVRSSDAWDRASDYLATALFDCDGDCGCVSSAPAARGSGGGNRTLRRPWWRNPGAAPRSLRVAAAGAVLAVAIEVLASKTGGGALRPKTGGRSGLRTRMANCRATGTL